MMDNYLLEGFYKYNGAQGKLSGEIEVDPDGFFENTIIDYMSRVPKQVVKGRIQTVDAVSKIEFFKFPPQSNLANLVYQLEKESTIGFSGKYVGKWGALPYKIDFNENLEMTLTRIDTSVCSIGDYAEIILSKK